MVSMDNKDENINMEHNTTDSNSGTQDQQPRPVRPGSEGERPVRRRPRPQGERHRGADDERPRRRPDDESVRERPRRRPDDESVRERPRRRPDDESVRERPRRRPDDESVRERPRRRPDDESVRERPRRRPDNDRSGENVRRRSEAAAGAKAKKKGWSKKKKGIVIAAIIIAVLLLVISILVAIIYRYINMMDFKNDSEYEVYDSIPAEIGDGTMSESPEDKKKSLDDALRANLEKNAKEIKSDKDVINVLLIGSDSRGGNDRGRSDTMILMSLNKKTKKVIMTSFLRDTWVNIPDIGPQRLNAAYAFGGPPLLMKTIQANFGVEVDKYAMINFGSFREIIDTLGGVEVNVKEAEIPSINAGAKDSGKEAITKPGKYNLDGAQALAYARIRKIDSDFQRTQRQRNVMEQVFKKAKALSLSELNDFLEKVLPSITTNLEKSEVFWMVLKASDYLGYERVQQSIPNTGSFENMVIDGMMVLGIDYEKYTKELQESIYG